MNRAQEAEVRRLGGDPTDATWRWLVLEGPHGASFSWGQTRGHPAGFVSVELLQRIADEREVDDPSFPGRARAVVNSALESHAADFVRRAIQVAAVVGGRDEARRVKALATHANASVAADARASAFYLRGRLARRG
ncbi:MAG: hypothetical protein AAFY88_00630 [Acidobacteriota bacterium]